MPEVTFLTILETRSSEVSKKNFFTKGSTIFIPDFFIIIFCMTLFYFSTCLDLFILLFLIFQTKMVEVIVFAMSIVTHGVCEFLIDRKENNMCCRKPNNISHSVLSLAFQKILEIPFYLMGLGSIFMSTRILIETLRTDRVSTKPLPVFPYSFFHISDENLSVIKNYYCLNLVLKSIPQLFIMSIFILGKNFKEGAAFMFVTNILFNTLIFCQTMALTFPLRRTPRVFTSCICVLFNALCKFMATMCACYLNLAVFAMAFKQISYCAILTHLLKSLIWVWPCWQLLKHQPVPLCKLYFITYMIFICIIFSFIYIHPFEGLGKLYYYLFYLLGFMYELINIYLLSDANLESITYYFTLKILMFGFLSSYGLLNIFHKYRKEEFVLHKNVNSNETVHKEDKRETGNNTEDKQNRKVKILENENQSK